MAKKGQNLWKIGVIVLVLGISGYFVYKKFFSGEARLTSFPKCVYNFKDLGNGNCLTCGNPNPQCIKTDNVGRKICGGC